MIRKYALVPVLALLLLAGALAAITLIPATAAAVNCSSFPSQAAAQAAYRADPVGLAHLDRDHDGIACEDNPAPYDRTPVNLTTTTPTATPSTPAASTAPTATPTPTATPNTPSAPVTGDGSAADRSDS